METLQAILFSILAVVALVASFYLTCIFCGVFAFAVFPLVLIGGGVLLVSLPRKEIKKVTKWDL